MCCELYSKLLRLLTQSNPYLQTEIIPLDPGWNTILDRNKEIIFDIAAFLLNYR